MRGNDVGCLHVQRILHQIYFLESDAEQRPHIQNEQNGDCRHDARQIDMPDALPAACPVHPRRLVQLRVDSRKGSQINDGTPAHLLPDAGQDVDAFEPGGIGQKVNGFPPEPRHGHIQQAGLRREKDKDHAHQNDRGQKMRRVRDRLDELAELFGADFIDHQGQNNRNRKTDDKLVETDAQRIRQQPPEIIAFEEPLEMFEAHPRAAPDSFGRDKIFKGNLYAVHGKILEHQEEDEDRHDKQIQIPVSPDPFKERGSFRFTDGRSGRGRCRSRCL